MQPASDSLSFRLLRGLTDVVYRYPRLVFYPQVILFVVCVFYTVDRLQFDTSRDNLVGSDKKYHQNFLGFKKEFPGQDDLVAVVESEDMEKNRQFVERLGARLEAETNVFTDVLYNNDLKLLGRKALLFLPDQDLLEFRKTLKEYRPFIQSFSQATNLNALFRLVNRQFRTARPEQNQENESMMKALPALQRIVEQATDSLRRPGTPPAPGMNALFGAGREAEERQYITFNVGRIFLVTAHARGENLNARAVKRLRELAGQTQVEVPGINVGITGEPVLEFDEMLQSQHDTTVASVVSLILVGFIFVYAYRETGRPIKATACLIVGLGYTMGYTTLTVGHLNILTITFVPMLIGLAIDFGVHLITRYEEELHHGRSDREAIEKAMVWTGKGICTGCFTTAAAFFAMALTDFKGIQEMGIISGGGMVICLVPMMTLLPVLLLRGKQNVIDHQAAAMDTQRARIEKLWLGRPALVVGVTAALALWSCLQFSKVYFDYNLLNMQSAGLPAVVYERKLIDSAQQSVLFGAVIADSLPQAVALEEKIKKLPAVGDVKSMSEFLAADQTNKLILVGEIKQEIAPIHFAPVDLQPVNLGDLSQTLTILQGSYLELALTEVRKEGDAALAKQLQALQTAVVELQHGMVFGDSAEVAAKLAVYQQALLNNVRETFGAIKDQDDSGPMQASDLPSALRNRFIGVTGKYLLQVYPKEDVWQRRYQEKFVRELRAAINPQDTGHPVITGTPVQLFEYTTLLKDSYVKAAYYALGAIAVMVFLHFGSLTSVVLALLPVAVGAVWMGGVMGGCGIPFNPANIMTLPLVVGIGVTNGIQILNRFAEEQNPSILAKSTGKAVLVSGLNTIAGFGSLILAKHQGIESLGYVMSIGTAACMVAGLTLLPAVLTLVKLRAPGNKKPSGENAQSTLGREEPR